MPNGISPTVLIIININFDGWSRFQYFFPVGVSGRSFTMVVLAGFGLFLACFGVVLARFRVVLAHFGGRSGAF